MSGWTKSFTEGDVISVLLDTSFLVAFYDSRDVNHPCAVELLKDLEAKKYGALFISDYIFDETITLLKKYIGNKRATEKGNDILNALELAMIDSTVFKSTWELSKKFDELSFTDCSSVALMRNYDITYIATFDAGFKKVANVLT